MSILVAAILLAGCTGLPGGAGGNGEDATATQGLELSLQQLETFALETGSVTLQMEAENVGQATADGITATLSGPSYLAGSQASLDSLEGADVAAGQSGDSTLTEWTFSDLPDVSQGEERVDDVEASVTYGYSTEGSIPVTLSEKAFVESSSEVAVEHTAGPLAVSTTFSSPVATGASNEHTVPITVENVGRGELDGDVEMSLQLLNPPSGVELTGECGDGTLTFSVAGTATRTCTLTSPDGGVPFETEVQIRTVSSYTYTQEVATTVTIRGVQ